MRVYKLCAILVVVTATLSSAQAPPIVVDLEPAAAITTGDRQEISRLLEASPKPAWLWTIQRGQAGGIWLVQAFAGPDVEQSNLRRGTATMIRGEVSSADVAVRNVAGSKSWVTGRTGSYAQVVMPNRTFQDIRGPKDPNLPFMISTTLTDDELVSLVTFLRTSPAGPAHAPDRVNRDSTGRVVIRDAKGRTTIAEPCSPGDFPIARVCGELPIQNVSATDGEVTVSIRLAVSKTQIVRLRRAGTNGTIIEITSALA